MNRTLNTTARRVIITLENDRQEATDELFWSATATVDGEPAIGDPPMLGKTVDQAFRLVAESLDRNHDGVLNDLPVRMPDNDVLRALVAATADSWEGAGEALPDWRVNEYMRGQIELIWNTCNVRLSLDEELEGEDAKDRIWVWIREEV